MATCTSHRVEDTVALGEMWGRRARPGWVFGLVGDLGSGKTQLARGIAAGLGLLDRVHSPTFSLINEYRQGPVPLFHLDLYRLETPAELEGAGVAEYVFDPPGVTVIEWVERWERWCGAGGLHLPAYPYFRITLVELPGGTRHIEYVDPGP